MNKDLYPKHFDPAESADLARQVEEAETTRSRRKRVSPLNVAAFDMLSQADMDEINSDPCQRAYVGKLGVDRLSPSSFVEESDELSRVGRSRIEHGLSSE